MIKRKQFSFRGVKIDEPSFAPVNDSFEVVLYITWHFFFTFTVILANHDYFDIGYLILKEDDQS